VNSTLEGFTRDAAQPPLVLADRDVPHTDGSIDRSPAAALHQDTSGCVYILLSTFNGEKYLQSQLDSLVTQSHTNWMLFWRDDGSDDATVRIMQDFSAISGANRCVRVMDPPSRVGPAASFMALLRAAMPIMRPQDTAAFMDQDDVWLPEKLERGITALARRDPGTPILYCARMIVVDAELRRLGETNVPPRSPGFPASLTQNVATGCSIMLNRCAASLAAASTPPAGCLHDWWCYLLITAAGGDVILDDTPVAMYRQHDGNVIGIPLSTLWRAIAAVRRGPGYFMGIFRQNLAALNATPELICPEAHRTVLRLLASLDGGRRERLQALSIPGLRRLGRLETLVFRLWFLIG
jgi:glycosyltransferase involved in cell wall biosynthesis